MIDVYGAPITGIDTHAHIFQTDLPMVKNRRYSPDYNATCNDYLANLNDHHMSHGVLVQPSFLGTNNDYLLNALKNYPTRLKGIAVVEANIPAEKLDEMNEKGIVGARLNLIGKSLENYATAEWKAFFKKLERLNWTVEIQRNIEDLPIILPDILDTGLKVIIDHFALPNKAYEFDNPSQKAFLDSLTTGTIWIKISAAYRCHANAEEAKAMFAVLRQAYGNDDHFLWGSDWPNTRFENQTNYTAQYNIMNALLSDTTVRQKVLVKNPAKLFHFIS